MSFMRLGIGQMECFTDVAEQPVMTESKRNSHTGKFPINYVDGQNAMQTKPLIGQTYVSRTTPDLVIYVVDVTDSELDDDIAFIVEGCDPAYKDDTVNADGYEITSEVWEKHDFALVIE